VRWVVSEYPFIPVKAEYHLIVFCLLGSSK